MFVEPHAEPRYVPFDGRPETISMGLRPLGDLAWLEVDRHRDEELAAKSRLLTHRHDDVVATIPEGDDASAETLQLVLAECDRLGLDRPPGADDEALRGLHPIDAAGRLVQEDLCVMVRTGERSAAPGRDAGGRWVLAAASVCAPSRWRLADKIGQELSAIHGPVPDYDTIERSVDRFFDRISVDRPVWRTNWTLLDDPERFQPAAPDDPAAADQGGIDAAAVVLRVERQTLRKLPRTDAVLFTIRTYVDRLDTLTPAARADLAGTLAEVPGAVIAYRGWSRVLPAVRAWAQGA